MATLELHPDYVLLESAHDTLFFRRVEAGWEVSHRGYDWRADREYVGLLPIQQTATSAFDTGELPLSLGGSWRAASAAASAGRGCTASLSPDEVRLTCGEMRDLGLEWLPSLVGRDLVLRKLADKESIFGDLGGDWQYESAAGTVCQLTFEGDRLTSSCDGPRPWNHMLSLTFGDGVASGVNRSGREILAVRR